MLSFTIFALLVSLAGGPAPVAQFAPPTIASPTIASPTIPSTTTAAQTVPSAHIPPGQARGHMNQVATVCGPIAGKHIAAGVATLIDLGSSSAGPVFRVILWASDKSRVGDLPSSGNICVTGVVGQAQGIPQIVLSDRKNWSLNETPAPAVAAPDRAAAPSVVAGPSLAAGPRVAAGTSRSVTSKAVAGPTVTAGPTVAARPSVAAAPTATARPSVAAAPSSPAAPSRPAAPEAAAVASQPVRSNVSAATSPSYRIGPDDALQITVWQEPTLSGSFLVRPDGMISLVLLGDVAAAGSTPMQLAAELTDKLKKFLQDPLVAVTVQAANSQKIYLIGEVQRVGPEEMATTMSPLQAIAAAGGLTPYANKRKIYILRGPADKQRKIPFDYKAAFKGNPNSSIPLMAGDTIVVP